MKFARIAYAAAAFGALSLSAGERAGGVANRTFSGIFPPEVKTVGIVSVSSLIPAASLERGTNLLAEAGYRVKVMPNVLKMEPPEVKARIFEQAWLDPEIDFLLFSRGGSGAEKVIPLIDWGRLRARNMSVLGFSDVTIVLGAMLAKGVGRPISGPSLSTLATYNSAESRARLRQVLDGAPPPIRLTPVKPCASAVAGKPFAGLISRFPVLDRIGFLPSFDGRVVFIESTPKYAEVSESMLGSLASKGVFEKAAAVVFCDFNRKSGKAEVDGIFARFAEKVPCPVFSGYPYGHVPMSFAVDFAREVTISKEGLLVWGSPVGMAQRGPEKADLSAQAIAAAEAAGVRPGQGGTLRIYTWSDYIAPDVIAGFERALGVKVVVDTFDSNEDMYARLKSGGASYDIVTPSSYQIEAMADAGMIDELDHTKIPNARKNFEPSFASQILDPSFAYSVPYAMTYTGLAYRKDKVPAGVALDSWAVLGDPALKGRVMLLDDIREVIGAGLVYLGYSVNSSDPAEINAAADQVIKWRGNVRGFDSEGYKAEVSSGESWVAQGYSTDVAQIIAGKGRSGAPGNGDVGFAIPKEGFAMAFDEMVVMKSAPRKDLAYAFINYVYDGDVAKATMECICGPSPVKPGLARLDPGFRAMITLTPAQLNAGQVLRGFDDQPGVMELYNKAWDRIMAAEAR